MGVKCLPHPRIVLLWHKLGSRPDKNTDLVLIITRYVFCFGYIVLLNHFFDFVTEMPVSVFSRCKSVHDFELEILVLRINLFGISEDFLCKVNAFINLALVEELVEGKEKVFVSLIETKNFTRALGIACTFKHPLRSFLDL
jgi:hypothetical protein